MADRDEAGRFKPGNGIWRMSSPGRKPTFADAGELWTAAVGYFEWVEANPLTQDNLVTFQGTATHEPTTRMRAMTLTGLHLFLGISHETWRGWMTPGHDLHRPDLVEIIATIEAVIWEQKFTGAAADLLNGSIIARELGLAEKREMSGPGGGPIQTEEVGPRERIAGRIARLAAGSAAEGDTGGAE